MKIKTEFGHSVLLSMPRKTLKQNPNFIARAQLAKREFCEECLNYMEQTAAEGGFIIYKCQNCGHIYKEK